MSVKAKQRQQVGGTNRLINTLFNQKLMAHYFLLFLTFYIFHKSDQAEQILDQFRENKRMGGV